MTTKDWIQQSIDTKKLLQEAEMLQQIDHVIQTCIETLEKGGIIFFCGNGGSAADAQHIAAELSVRYKTERPSLPGIALGTNFSHLTAAGNDYGFDQVFARQLNGLGKPGDLLIGLSTSGNSKNIIAAVQAANKIGMTSVCWTGSTGGSLKDISTYCLRIPSMEVPRIQECHLLIGHIICEYLDEKFS